MIDVKKQARTRVLAAPVDADKPLGIAAPQLQGDIGWDLVAMEDVLIGPMDAADVPVNLRLQLPRGYYCDIRNRSSMARRGLYVDQNLVDEGYRGRMYVFIRNMHLPLMRALTDAEVRRLQGAPGGGIVVPGQEEQPYDGPNVAAIHPSRDQGSVLIKEGERIAQLVFHRADPVWVEPAPEIDEGTQRGANGFGSTGA